MMVSLVAIAGPEPGYLAVGMVEDHVLALAEACVVSLPPGEHRLSPVCLDLEVERVFLFITLEGVEPYWLPAIVNDQRSVLAGPARPWLLLRGDEDVTWGRTVRLRPYLDGWRAELRPRTEGPRLLPPCRRSDSSGARALLTAQGASQRDPGATSSHSPEEPSSRDLAAQSPSLPLYRARLAAQGLQRADVSLPLATVSELPARYTVSISLARVLCRFEWIGLQERRSSEAPIRCLPLIFAVTVVTLQQIACYEKAGTWVSPPREYCWPPMVPHTPSLRPRERSTLPTAPGRSSTSSSSDARSRKPSTSTPPRPRRGVRTSGAKLKRCWTSRSGRSRRRAATLPSLTSSSEERRVGKECRSRWSPYH